MEGFEVEENSSTQFEQDVQPSHKISITHGSNKYIYWYGKKTPSCRTFDRLKDLALVKQMHENGMKLNIGESISFSIAQKSDYHISRKDSHTFVVTALT